jgi:hypothetical protein
MTLDYRAWIKGARERLAALEQERQAIDMEMAALEQSIRAFEPLVSTPPPSLRGALDRGVETTVAGDWLIPGLPPLGVATQLGDYADIGLTDAIRAAIKASTNPLEPTEIRDLIVHGGFDLSGRSNAMANIHQVLRRLVAQQELKEVPSTDGKTRFEWIGSKSVDDLGWLKIRERPELMNTEELKRSKK